MIWFKSIFPFEKTGVVVEGAKVDNGVDNIDWILNVMVLSYKQCRNGKRLWCWFEKYLSKRAWKYYDEIQHFAVAEASDGLVI